MSGDPNAPSYRNYPSRPLGVAILAVLIGLFGFLWIVGGIVLIAIDTTFGNFDTGGLPALLHASGFIAGLIVLIIGLIIVGLALGLWHQRMWALVLTLLVLIVELVSYGLAGAFVSLGFLVSLVLFIYLVAVHQHFR